MSGALLKEARAISGYIEDIFYDIHSHPELGRQEFRTQALILRELEKMGIEARPIADTGVLGIIRGAKPGKTIGFRADIDALPIHEESGLSYASTVPGVMHACGHDSHTASLLGAAKLLMAHRDELCGNVKLFFQPNEEGDGGAERMIQEGCLENPKVDAAFCAHVMSAYPTGSIAVRSRSLLAASNYFVVKIYGKGSHGAQPHNGDDVIVAGSQIVNALQTISSRRCSPTEPVVVTVGSFHAGTAGNILSETAELTGIIRTLSPDSRTKVKRLFREIVEGVAAAMGVKVEITITESYPAAVNDPVITDVVRRAGAKLLGSENVIEIPEPRLGTDDFGYFSLAVPSSYYFVGMGAPEKYPVMPGHNPRYVVDPEALPIAAAMYAQISLDFLAE